MGYYGDDFLHDGLNFDELETTILCNCKEINKKEILSEYKKLMKLKERNAMFLLQENLSSIENKLNLVRGKNAKNYNTLFT